MERVLVNAQWVRVEFVLLREWMDSIWVATTSKVVFAGVLKDRYLLMLVLLIN